MGYVARHGPGLNVAQAKRLSFLHIPSLQSKPRLESCTVLGRELWAHFYGEEGEGDADSREEWKSGSRTAGQAEVSPNDLEQRSGGQGCFL